MKIVKANQDYPMSQLESEIEALELALSRTASNWRATKDAEYVKQYHDIYHKLRSLSWDGGIDVEAELPDRLMPQEYLDMIRARAGK
jgi:hypothetical protein